MDFRSLVIPIRMKEGFTMVNADSIPVRALSFSLLLYFEGCELFTAIQPGYSPDIFLLVFWCQNANVVWN